MFYRQQSNQYINEGTSFEIDNIQYPPQWLNQSTPEQKAALGLEEVVAQNQPYNPVYYWTGEVLDKATLTYTGTPKDLAEVKNNCVFQVEAISYTILLPSDWMASKAFETSTTVPAAWATWRESIRQTARDTVAAINAAADVDGVASVMANIVWANDPNYVAPAQEPTLTVVK